MPPKKCCLKCGNPQNPYICFKKGVGVGYRLAQTPKLSTLTLRELGTIASKYKVKNYGKMTKSELVDALTEAGYKNV